MGGTAPLQTTSSPLVGPEEGELYLAGQRVPSGLYRETETLREVCLEREDCLPASLDGRVACYELVCNQWGQRRDAHCQPP